MTKLVLCFVNSDDNGTCFDKGFQKSFFHQGIQVNQIVIPAPASFIL